MQDQGREGGMKIAHQCQRLRTTLQRPYLLRGLVMADSRTGGQVVLCDVISMNTEIPELPLTNPPPSARHYIANHSHFIHKEAEAQKG